MIKKYINKSGRDNTCNRQDAPYIIESVDFISRDGPGMYIYVIHHKTPNISEQVNFNFNNHNLQQIFYLSSPRMFMRTIVFV